MLALMALPAQDPNWEWVEALHTPDEERGTSVASDSNTREVYFAGEWRGALDGYFPAPIHESTDFASTFERLPRVLRRD